MSMSRRSSLHWFNARGQVNAEGNHNHRTGSNNEGLAPGFTLAELLVVIVVIGILAAIAIPVFLSQADKASDTALKSDLTNAAKLLQIAEASGEALPSEFTAGEVVELGSAGTFTASQDLTVTGSAGTLCVEGISGSGDVYSLELSEGMRNYDCWGNRNGVVFSGGASHTCKFTKVEGLQCWGSNQNGGQISVPTLDEGDQWVDLSTGEFYTCGLTQGHELRCWGDASSGQQDSPELASGTRWEEVSAGFRHTCAVTDAGGVQCWGRDDHGETNVPAELTTSGAVDVSTGRTHTCAVTVTGGVRCWGKNHYGQSNVPAELQQSGVTSVAAGGIHACVLLDSGGIQCWGISYYGATDVPERLSGTRWIDVVVGLYHTCGLTDAGGVQCWGADSDSWADRNQSVVPSEFATSGVSAITARLWHTCVLTDAGGVRCWGSHPTIPPEFQ